jgi:hypothetical protein
MMQYDDPVGQSGIAYVRAPVQSKLGLLRVERKCRRDYHHEEERQACTGRLRA